MTLPTDRLGLDEVERRVLLRVAKPGMPLPSRRLDKARREARDRLVARGFITSVSGGRLTSLTDAGKRMVAAVRLTDGA